MSLASAHLVFNGADQLVLQSLTQFGIKAYDQPGWTERESDLIRQLQKQRLGHEASLGPPFTIPNDDLS